MVGATERMNLFWQKVLNRQCVKMVVLGASVSVGVNVGGIEEVNKNKNDCRYLS